MHLIFDQWIMIGGKTVIVKCICIHQSILIELLADRITCNWISTIECCKSVIDSVCDICIFFTINSISRFVYCISKRVYLICMLSIVVVVPCFVIFFYELIVEPNISFIKKSICRPSVTSCVLEWDLFVRFI